VLIYDTSRLKHSFSFFLCFLSSYYVVQNHPAAHRTRHLSPIIPLSVKCTHRKFPVMPSGNALNSENKHKFIPANRNPLTAINRWFFWGTLVATVNRLDRVDKTLDRNRRLTSLSVIRRKPYWIPLDIRVWQNTSQRC